MSKISIFGRIYVYSTICKCQYGYVYIYKRDNFSFIWSHKMNTQNELDNCVDMYDYFCCTS